MFDKDNESVIDFLEIIEDKIKNLIYEKKDTWFHSDMDMDTIDYHWQIFYDLIKAAIFY